MLRQQQRQQQRVPALFPHQLQWRAARAAPAPVPRYRAQCRLQGCPCGQTCRGAAHRRRWPPEPRGEQKRGPSTGKQGQQRWPGPEEGKVTAEGGAGNSPAQRCSKPARLAGVPIVQPASLLHHCMFTQPQAWQAAADSPAAPAGAAGQERWGLWGATPPHRCRCGLLPSPPQSYPHPLWEGRVGGRGPGGRMQQYIERGPDRYCKGHKAVRPAGRGGEGWRAEVENRRF